MNGIQNNSCFLMAAIIHGYFSSLFSPSPSSSAILSHSSLFPVLSQVDPFVNLMMVEKVPESTSGQAIKAIMEELNYLSSILSSLRLLVLLSLREACEYAIHYVTYMYIHMCTCTYIHTYMLTCTHTLVG